LGTTSHRNSNSAVVQSSESDSGYGSNGVGTGAGIPIANMDLGNTSPGSVRVLVQPANRSSSSSNMSSSNATIVPPRTSISTHDAEDPLAVRMNTIRTLQHPDREREFKREFWLQAITGIPICLATIIMLILEGINIPGFRKNECEDDSKLLLWCVVNMMRLMIQIGVFSYLLVKNIDVSPLSSGGKLRAYINTFALLWLVIGLYFIVSFRNCREDILYQFLFVFVFCETIIVLLPCVLFILMLPLICLCLPCVLRILLRMQLSHAKGGTATEINNIPTIKYGEDTLEGVSHRDDNRCSICLTDYEKGEEVRVLPCAGKHYFHKSCVDSWLLLNGSCPYCRETVCGRSRNRSNSNSITRANSSAETMPITETHTAIV